MASAFEIGDERKVYPLEPYSQLILNGSFEVQIYRGDREEVILEGPDHFLADIAVSQLDSKVIVSDKPHKNKSVRKISVRVYLKNVQLQEINDISRLECKTPIKSDFLKLYCNDIRYVEFDLNLGDLKAVFEGIGSTYLSSGVETVKIECAGIGNIYATDFRFVALHFESAGIGKAEIYADKELYVAMAGTGSVKHARTPEIKSISKGGISRVKSIRK